MKYRTFLIIGTALIAVFLLTPGDVLIRPSYGFPGYGYPSYGYPSYGYPAYGYPGYGYPGYGYPGYGYPGYSYPGYNYPGYNYPGYNYPGYNYPSYNYPRLPDYSYPTYNYPTYNYPSYNYPSYNYPSYNYPAELQEIRDVTKEISDPALRQNILDKIEELSKETGGSGETKEQILEKIQNLQDQALRDLGRDLKDVLERGTFAERLDKILKWLQARNKFDICKLNPNLPQCKTCQSGEIDIRSCQLIQPEIRYTCRAIQKYNCVNGVWVEWGECEYIGEDCVPLGPPF